MARASAKSTLPILSRAIMRIDAAKSLARAKFWGRQPVFWLALLLIALIALMPLSAPLFRTLFPGDPHPLYTRASFFELTVAHCQLVAISSLIAATIGIGLGIFVTRQSGREFAPMVSAIAAVGADLSPRRGAGARHSATWLRRGANALRSQSLRYTANSRRRHHRDSRRPHRRAGMPPQALVFRHPISCGGSICRWRCLSSSLDCATPSSSISERRRLAQPPALCRSLAHHRRTFSVEPRYVIQGAVIVALLAVVVDRGFAALEELLRPA